MSAEDQTWMRRAIALAQAQLGRTAPNPAVGCVIVKDGEVVGEGATGDGGRPHAEEVALAAAGPQARGAVAYVTLEPCGERSSGAPSCGERLAAARVARVAIACADASALAGGRGLAKLRGGQVRIDLGVLAAEARPLYADHVPRAPNRAN